MLDTQRERMCVGERELSLYLFNIINNPIAIIY